MNKRFIKVFNEFRSNNGFDMELKIDENVTLFACGLDSLDRISLLQFIESRMNVSIDSSEIDSRTTIGQLNELVSGLLGEDGGYVDLGLTSGTLWAKENAELDGKRLFAYDEAVENFGDKMPTAAQIVELATECKHEWTMENGKNGMKFIGPNENSIFFPADGCTWKGKTEDEPGRYGYVWSKTPSVNGAARAYYLYFNSGFVRPLNSNGRALGFSVRPVRE